MDTKPPEFNRAGQVFPIQELRARGMDMNIKVAFFTVGLTFGALSLAIPSATLDLSKWSTWIELLAWLCLLTSGLAGLVRLTLAPGHYLGMSVWRHDKKHKRRGTRIQRSYRLHMVALYVGLVILAVARGWAAIEESAAADQAAPVTSLNSASVGAVGKETPRGRFPRRTAAQRCHG